MRRRNPDEDRQDAEIRKVWRRAANDLQAAERLVLMLRRAQEGVPVDAARVGDKLWGVFYNGRDMRTAHYRHFRNYFNSYESALSFAAKQIYHDKVSGYRSSNILDDLTADHITEAYGHGDHQAVFDLWDDWCQDGGTFDLFEIREGAIQ